MEKVCYMRVATHLFKKISIALTVLALLAAPYVPAVCHAVAHFSGVEALHDHDADLHRHEHDVAHHAVPLEDGAPAVAAQNSSRAARRVPAGHVVFKAAPLSSRALSLDAAQNWSAVLRFSFLWFEQPHHYSHLANAPPA
jgi:hypothetical protein